METITERSDEELVARTDRLIAELSSTLIRIEGDSVAAAVDDALRRLGESLDVDRCLIIECIDNNASVDAVFHWSRPALGAAEGETDVAPLKALLDGWHGTQDVQVFERIPEDLPVDVLAAIADDAVPRIAMTSAAVVRITVPGIDGLTCLMVVGLAMGVSVVALPAGIPLGLVGLFVFLWGLFGWSQPKRVPTQPPTPR